MSLATRTHTAPECRAASRHRRADSLAARCVAAVSVATMLPQLKQGGGLRHEQPSREPSGWAVVRIGQMKEWIEVGRALAVPSATLREADGALGKVVRFTEVLACKAPGGSLLLRGSPSCTNVVVEGVVEDVFMAPSTVHNASPVPLSKVLVTAIRVPRDAGLAVGEGSG